PARCVSRGLLAGGREDRAAPMTHRTPRRRLRSRPTLPLTAFRGSQLLIARQGEFLQPRRSLLRPRLLCLLSRRSPLRHGLHSPLLRWTKILGRPRHPRCSVSPKNEPAGRLLPAGSFAFSCWGLRGADAIQQTAATPSQQFRRRRLLHPRPASPLPWPSWLS